jgi:hypothetical protein
MTHVFFSSFFRTLDSKSKIGYLHQNAHDAKATKSSLDLVWNKDRDS